MALAAKANDRNLAGLDQIHIRIAVIVNAHLPFLLLLRRLSPELIVAEPAMQQEHARPQGRTRPVHSFILRLPTRC
jgi:hypothetical protein